MFISILSIILYINFSQKSTILRKFLEKEKKKKVLIRLELMTNAFRSFKESHLNLNATRQSCSHYTTIPYHLNANFIMIASAAALMKNLIRIPNSSSDTSKALVSLTFIHTCGARLFLFAQRIEKTNNQMSLLCATKLFQLWILLYSPFSLLPQFIQLALITNCAPDIFR